MKEIVYQNLVDFIRGFDSQVENEAVLKMINLHVFFGKN